jgi:hypothetical protein
VFDEQERNGWISDGGNWLVVVDIGALKAIYLQKRALV